jgi:hypothetical protein
MKQSTSILRMRCAEEPKFLKSLGCISNTRALRWKVETGFHPQKTIDYVEYCRLLSSLLQQTEILPLRVALGTLFIQDGSFRKLVEYCSRKWWKEIEIGKEAPPIYSASHTLLAAGEEFSANKTPQHAGLKARRRTTTAKRRVATQERDIPLVSVSLVDQNT